MRSRPLLLSVGVTCALILASAPALSPAQEAPSAERSRSAQDRPPRIQVALLLDTSSSMSGLIDQARTQLWSIVNELAEATQQGVQPELEVALYEYGNDGLSAESGYVRRRLGFTRDLDRVSEELFALTTNGGSEYCGWVMQQALAELEWSQDPRDLRVLYVAGNEPFTQGPVDFRTVAAEARARDIRVNTIHCGPAQQGVAGFWHEGAQLAGGAYLSIDHDQAVVELAAPQDTELAALNSRLNETFVPYGPEGERGRQRQLGQDGRAASTSEANLAKRAISKASGLADSQSWDLVDALSSGRVELDALEPEAIPEPMRTMSTQEKQAFVEQKRTERKKLESRIRTLKQQRDVWVAEEKARQAQDAPTLGDAIRDSVREQAQQKAYDF